VELLAWFAASARRGPTGFQLVDHIFVGETGDYHEIADGLPQAWNMTA
jgi:hypothetical protein